MKNMLIIAMSLEIGGAEKSLVNMLNLLDYSKYKVDLLLFQKKGGFLDQVPESVHIIDDIEPINILFQSFRTTISSVKNHFISSLVLSLKRYYFTLISTVTYRQFDRIKLNRWIRYYRRIIPVMNPKYDIALAYAGGETLYYMVDKVDAGKKITYYHSDYSKIKIDATLEEQYLKKVDAVVTISDVCKDSLITLFPGQKEKIHVFPNLTSPNRINRLSCEYYPEEFKSANKNAVIVSVGRLHKIKGFDLAIEAANLLKKKGKRFTWFIVGEGSEYNRLRLQIEKNNLQNEFILLGVRSNPYPYIKNADLLVQPSRFEGKSVVLDEAKILHKPIVVTNYNSAADQIENGVTGIIAPMNAVGIANGVDLMMSNAEIKNRIIENLIKKNYNTDKNMNEFYDFIEGI